MQTSDSIFATGHTPVIKKIYEHLVSVNNMMMGSLHHTTKLYLDELSGETVVFTPVQVLEGELSFCCSKLHQAVEGALLQPHITKTELKYMIPT